MNLKKWILAGLILAIGLNAYLWRKDYLTANELPIIEEQLRGLPYELAERPVQSDFNPLSAGRLIEGLQPVYMDAISRRDVSMIDQIEPCLKSAMNATQDSIFGTYATLRIKSGIVTGKLTFCVLKGGKVVVF